MAYNTRAMLTDVNGDLIPQWYDPTTDSYKPLTQDLNNVIVRSENGQQLFTEGNPGSVQPVGSLVVIAELGVTTVTAGSEIEIFPFQIRNDFRELRYAFKTFPEGSYVMGLRYRTSSGEQFPTKNINLQNVFYGIGTLEDKISYNRYSAFFRNESTTNKNITALQILGVR